MAYIGDKKVAPTSTEQGTQDGQIVAKLSRRFGEKQVGFIDDVGKSKTASDVAGKLQPLYGVAKTTEEKESLTKIISKLYDGEVDKDFGRAFMGQIRTERAIAVGEIIELKLPKIEVINDEKLKQLSKPLQEEAYEIIDKFCKDRDPFKKGEIVIDDTGPTKSKPIDTKHLGGLRIDCQNIISDESSPYLGYANFQIQAVTKDGNDSYAKVLIERGVPFSIDKIQEAFKQALSIAVTGEGKTREDHAVVLHRKD